MAAKPPFPSFAASAITQIEVGLMDDYLDAFTPARVCACRQYRRRTRSDKAVA